MQWKTKGLLFASSLLNAVICFLSFWFMVFATSPDMDDVSMRIGFYVMNLISISALVAVFAPWIFAYRNRNKAAVIFAMLPALLLCLAALAFLTLDSWLNRTFASEREPTSIAAADGRLPAFTITTGEPR